jgi:hypothetical protein
MPTGVYPVFNVELVRPVATDPFPSQLVDDTQPPPIEIDNEVEYEVEEILNHKERRIGRGKRTEVLVKWTGYAETTWEPADEMKNCIAMDTYERQFGRITRAVRPRIAAKRNSAIPVLRLSAER